MNKHRRMLAQITDYAKRHSVIDDGYNEVMACGDSLRRQMQRNERLLQVIHRMQQLKQSPTAVLKARLTVTPSGSRHAVEARKVMRKDGMLVLQTYDEQLPDGASRFSVYRLGTYHSKPGCWLSTTLASARLPIRPTSSTPAWLPLFRQPREVHG